MKEECCFHYTPLEESIISKLFCLLGARMRLKMQKHQAHADPEDCIKASKLCTHSASRCSALAHPQGRAELICILYLPDSHHMVSSPEGTHPASHRPWWPPLICRICRIFWVLWPATIFVWALQQLLIISALPLSAVAWAICSKILSISVRRICQGHRCWTSV